MAKALYRIYRPTTFEEVIGQSHVTKTIQQQLLHDALVHAYLFTGPRGVGKTTIARLVAKAVNCTARRQAEPCNACLSCLSITDGTALDVFEIDAASHTDVDHVREQIIQNVRFMPHQLKRKVYIIDEVHMLSLSAFNALLKTLEEPPEHVMFILATTEIHKVPETIISRCQRYDFHRVPQEILTDRLCSLANKEGVAVDKEVLEDVARLSQGCVRDAESLLGQLLSLGEKEVTRELASLVMPSTQAALIAQFVQSLGAKKAGATIDLLNRFLEEGVQLRQFVYDVISTLRDELLATIAGTRTNYSIDFLHQAIQLLLEASSHIKTEQLPQLPIELAIVSLCGDQPRVAPENTQKDFPSQEVDLILQKKTDEPAKPVAVNEVVFDSIPVVSLDEVKEKWPIVFQHIRDCNASLPLFLQACEVHGVAGDELELAFEYDLYVQTMNKDKNRKLIEDVFERVLGKHMKIKAVMSQKRKENDEAVNVLVEQFGGSVV